MQLAQSHQLFPNPLKTKSSKNPTEKLQLNSQRLTNATNLLSTLLNAISAAEDQRRPISPSVVVKPTSCKVFAFRIRTLCCLQLKMATLKGNRHTSLTLHLCAYLLILRCWVIDYESCYQSWSWTIRILEKMAVRFWNHLNIFKTVVVMGETAIDWQLKLGCHLPINVVTYTSFAYDMLWPLPRG